MLCVNSVTEEWKSFTVLVSSSTVETIYMNEVVHQGKSVCEGQDLRAAKRSHWSLFYVSKKKTRKF